MLVFLLFGAALILVCAFIGVAGWRDVADLFRETEQERIDREFAAIVGAWDQQN